jgi:hypothetical protein
MIILVYRNRDQSRLVFGRSICSVKVQRLLLGDNFSVLFVRGKQGNSAMSIWGMGYLVAKVSLCPSEAAHST